MVLFAHVRRASSVAIGNASDVFACFSGDPTTQLLPGHDAWEDLIDPTFNREIGFGRTTLEISALIRRGKYGMDGLCNWTESCFESLNIAPALLEARLEKVINAMLIM